MVRLTASVYHHPPLFPSAFCDFFGVFLNLDYDYMCSETDFAQEKVNFHVLESPIPPLTAAALRMIICKRPAPHFDNHEKGIKNAFSRPFTMRYNVF